MITIVAFDNIEELCKMANKTRKELWDAGIDLDDCDGGFVTLDPLIKHITYEDGWNHYEVCDNVPCALRRVLLSVDTLYDIVEYELDGKYFYLMYH